MKPLIHSSFTELQKQYGLWLSALGFSHSIVYNYPKMVFYFLEHLTGKDLKLNQINQSHINDYINHLQSRENKRKRGLSRDFGRALSTAHLNKSFDALDKFIEFLNQNTQTSISPTNYRILQTKNDYIKSLKYLSKEEIKTLYASVDNLFTHFTFKESEPRKALATLILDLCYGCGLRRSEAYQLRIKDIDLDKKLIYINQGKGYKDRYVPLTDKIVERIQLFIYQYRRRFSRRQNYLIPLSKEGIYAYFKNIRKEARIEGAGLHTLRHSIATHLLQNGMSIEQIAKFLGHSSLESTQVYTHLISVIRGL